MTKIVTCQSYLDRSTVEKKRRTRDYNVLLSREFEVDGVVYQVVMDGHHSLAAAKLDGISPCFSVASPDEDAIAGLLQEVGLADFLLEAAARQSESSHGFFDVNTGEIIKHPQFFWPGAAENIPEHIKWP